MIALKQYAWLLAFVACTSSISTQNNNSNELIKEQNSKELHSSIKTKEVIFEEYKLPEIPKEPEFQKESLDKYNVNNSTTLDKSPERYEPRVKKLPEVPENSMYKK